MTFKKHDSALRDILVSILDLGKKSLGKFKIFMK